MQSLHNTYIKICYAYTCPNKHAAEIKLTCYQSEWRERYLYVSWLHATWMTAYTRVISPFTPMTTTSTPVSSSQQRFSAQHKLSIGFDVPNHAIPCMHQHDMCAIIPLMCHNDKYIFVIYMGNRASRQRQGLSLILLLRQEHQIKLQRLRSENAVELQLPVSDNDTDDDWTFDKPNPLLACCVHTDWLTVSYYCVDMFNM